MEVQYTPGHALVVKGFYLTTQGIATLVEHLTRAMTIQQQNGTLPTLPVTYTRTTP